MALLGRDTSVSGPFPEGVLLLETFSGRERLGAPYCFHLTLLSKDPNIKPKDVLGKPLAVGIHLSTGGKRYFHGVVTEFTKAGTTRLHTRYAATLRPEIALLSYASDCRVFNQPHQDALSIVAKVMDERHLTEVDSNSIKGHAFRAREYCVQYRESDLHFVQRLLEEEGIYYFFRHEEGKHTLVLADSIVAHETSDGYENVPYTPKERQAAGAREHFWQMSVRQLLYPGRHTVLSGYDPTQIRPKQAQFGEKSSSAPHPGREFEHYDYPGGFFDSEEAKQEAALRAQLDCAGNTLIQVKGNTLGLGAGDLVSLLPGLDGAEVFPFWDERDFLKQYLIVSATYSLSIDQYESGTVSNSDEPFKATYWLLDSQLPFRPKPSAHKPRMAGSQTALVVGPNGQEIWTDEFGRVKVQFDWDRLGQRDEESSCWVRVSQAWAGAGWGAIHIPRIGHEVIVDFEDGDPDRPLITGRLYNADNPPPYDLPAHQTQSGIKSRSSKGGTASNFNEIRLEDSKGHEKLHMQAEKDMSTLVKHNQKLDVGVDRAINVGNDETTWVRGNRTTTVGTDPTKNKDDVIINGTHDKTVLGRVTQIYADDHARKVDGEQELHVEKNKFEHVKLAYTLVTDQKFELLQSTTSMTFEDTNVTLDAGGSITMKAGGATLNVDKAGMVTLSSPTGINLLCGSSGLSILPGGIAISAAAVSAAAGGASIMEMGEKVVTMKSKTISIEADNICSVKGKNTLKLNSP